MHLLKTPIRRAKSSDARGIAKVHVAAWKAAYRGLLPDNTLDQLSVDDSEARWKERLAGAWGKILVAEQKDRIIGFAACGASRDEDLDKVGELYVIYVHPEEWRKGYGATLIGEAMKHLREAGFEEVVLWVLRGNQQAIRFYEAAGFVADGASKVKQRTDGTELPVIRYRQSLG